jgi:hypothetical protein
LTRQEAWDLVAAAARAWLDANGLGGYAVDVVTGDMTSRVRVRCRGSYYEPEVRLSVRIEGGVAVVVREEER